MKAIYCSPVDYRKYMESEEYAIVLGTETLPPGEVFVCETQEENDTEAFEMQRLIAFNRYIANIVHNHFDNLNPNPLSE